MGKIVYNKERSGKLIGRGGPRDIQQRQRLIQEGSMVREVLAFDKTSFKPQIVDEKKEKNLDIDLSQYLPLTEVRKKIEEAVMVVQQQEMQRYEGGLKNINDQLNTARKESHGFHEKLIEVTSKFEVKSELYEKASKDVEDLKTKLENASDLLKERDIKIAELRTQVETKEDIYGKMQEKLDRLYGKIADGSISPLVGSKMDRPALEDRIFIDPLEPGKEPELDSHIKIQEEKLEEESKERNMQDDLAKLRNLLKMS